MSEKNNSPKTKAIIILCVLIALIVVAAGALILIIKDNSGITNRALNAPAYNPAAAFSAQIIAHHV